MTTTTLAARWRSWAPYLLSVIRIVAAFVFMQFGSAKLVAIPAAIMPGGGTAPQTSLPGFAGSLELVGGALLLLGLFTRPVAFLLSGEMAFIWLYISSAGPGPWSLDALRGRHEPTT
jgi:putative oxidoreductase